MRTKFWIGLAASLTLLAACGDSDNATSATCAQGTQLVNNQCEAIINCGEGTELVNNVCAPSGTTNVSTCGAGTIVNADDECVPDAGACGEGTSLNGGICVPDGDIACGAGTTLSGTDCVVDTSMVCGPGTTFTAGTNACELNCAAGQVWDTTSSSCVDSCGSGSQFDTDNGVCIALCPSDQTFNEGAGCEDVPTCSDGTTQNPEGNCTAWPFDDLNSDTLCARWADYRCDELATCCGDNQGPNYSESDERGRAAYFRASDAECFSREQLFCETQFGASVFRGSGSFGTGISSLRWLSDNGFMTVDQDALDAMDELIAAMDCFVPEEFATYHSYVFGVGGAYDPGGIVVDGRIEELLAEVFLPAVPDFGSCLYDDDVRLPDYVCVSGYCGSTDEASDICLPRIGLPTFDGEGEPIAEEICSPFGLPQCQEDLVCANTWQTLTDENPYYFCVNPKNVGARCEEFDDINPCAEGLVCRESTVNDGTSDCQAIGEMNDPCSNDALYDTCIGGLFCDGGSETCQPLHASGFDCQLNPNYDLDSSCVAGLVCRRTQWWDIPEGAPATPPKCLPFLTTGNRCPVSNSENSDRYCGDTLFCNDAADTCDDPDALTCPNEANFSQVGGCVARIADGAFCDWCLRQDATSDFNGCSVDSSCTVNADDSGDPVNACNAGIPICRVTRYDIELGTQRRPECPVVLAEN